MVSIMIKLRTVIGEVKILRAVRGHQDYNIIFSYPIVGGTTTNDRVKMKWKRLEFAKTQTDSEVHEFLLRNFQKKH